MKTDGENWGRLSKDSVGIVLPDFFNFNFRFPESTSPFQSIHIWKSEFELYHNRRSKYRLTLFKLNRINLPEISSNELSPRV